MSDEGFEIALIKYSKKTWSKSAVLGFFIGLAVIVPGISGSTVAIIFKLYDQFLYAIGNLFKRFKKCFLFLLPIVIGIIIGCLLGFVAVKKLLALLPFAITCLFTGLMCGAFPAVSDEIRGAKWSKRRIALFSVGVLLPVAMGCLSAVLTLRENGSGGDLFAVIDFWHVLLAVFVGAIMGITQIVPGLSASAFMMALGWFAGIVESIDFAYWQTNPQIFIVYGALAVGFLGGIFLFSKLLTFLFTKVRHTAYFTIVGLSLGSILAMFCNGDIVEVFAAWKAGTAANPVLDIVLGVVLFALGVVAAYMLVRYERRKATEEKSVEKQIQNERENQAK